MLKRNLPIIVYLGLIAIGLGIDLITKYIIEITYTHIITIIPGLLQIDLVFNRGASFGIFSNFGGVQIYFLLVIAFIASVAMIAYIIRQNKYSLYNTAISLIAIGALGNMIDRFMDGKVTDFIVLGAFGYIIPNFNVADMAISCGFVLLIIESFGISTFIKKKIDSKKNG